MRASLKAVRNLLYFRVFGDFGESVDWGGGVGDGGEILG